MRAFTVTEKDEGRRLDRWIARELPTLPMGQRQKYLRLKRFKINGKAAKGETPLHAGDLIEVYLNDESFERPRRENPFLRDFKPQLRIVFEDEGLLVADKKPGLLVHADGSDKTPTLLTHANAYLYQKGEYDGTGNVFAPALCNRIDRFTGGLVLIAKNEPVLLAMNKALRTRQVHKQYLCIVHGELYGSGALDSYLLKPQGAKKVQILDEPAENAKLAQSRYEALAHQNGLTLLKVDLLTGYTHQIRAQFAHIGHPLLGDGQYGDKRKNAAFDQGYQALCAAHLSFALETPEPALIPYQNLALTVSDIPFARKFFPDVNWQIAFSK